MESRIPRREFLATVGGMAAAAAASSLPSKAVLASEKLYPPADLSYFDTPISRGPARIHIGYAAITWGGNDRQAIEDISALGYRGIQLRSNCIAEFSSPQELRELLDKKSLQMVALSSGSVNIDPAVEADQISACVAHAQFTRDAGGLYLQVTDQRPKGRAIVAADYQRLGQLLTEIGKRTADLGISLGYHNHMGTLGQRPEEVDQILEACDPRYAKLLLDVGHYYQGGGDPAKAIEKYHDRLLFLHVKDVEELPQSTDPKHTYRWVELGRGKVDIPALFAALKNVKFHGWAVIELDSEPDPSRTPKESAAMAEKYLEERIGIKV
ncbi:MAG: sugar phosphate isomerase/epimerase family protein [Candidatus Acidiferrales bacterium]